MSNAFVAVLLIELHFPDPTNGCAVGARGLKGKRAELAPLKAHLHKLGAAVAEVDHQDLWQRATLAAAVVAGAPGRLDAHVAAITGWIDGRFPQGARVERTVASFEDLVGLG